MAQAKNRSEEISEIKEDVAVLASNLKSLETSVNKMAGVLEKVITEITVGRRFPTGTFAAFGGVGVTFLIAMVGVLWMGMQMTVTNTAANLNAELLPVKTTASQLSNIVDDHGARIATLEQQAVKTTAAMTEVETQFCAASNVINLMHHQDSRLLSVLFHKEFGIDYPTDLFNPNLCKS